ncbi:MAG TPA: RIP metalloprotease RseP [Alphaproteobacteria bacterium]
MDTLISFGHTILSFLVVFTVVVFVHEFGHYWVARRCGVRVEVFSIGFGRELFGITDRAGTRWKLGLVPLGGFVRFFGDENAASRPALGLDRMTPEDRSVSFHYKPLGQRALIVAAGPLANFVLSIVLLTSLFVTVGRPITPAVVNEVLPDSAAMAAGFQPGDRVVSIGDTAIERFEELREIVMFSPGVAMAMVVERAGKMVPIQVTPEDVEITDSLGNPHHIGRLGISVAAREFVRLDPLRGVAAAVVDTYDLVARSLQGLGEILIGKRDSAELGGPIMIAQMSGERAEAGALALIEFVVILSATLGLINLFPIPLLDGGHLAFYAFEAVRGRPLGMRAQELGYMVGLAVVVTLMVFATVNDLSRPAVIDFFTRLVG